jgi:glycosyltransferase involved in cell wall biosynthesis
VFLNGILGRQQLSSWQPTLVHETYFSKIKSGATNCPTVLTVFDMISDLGVDGALPSEAQILRSNKYAAVQRADHVICISECTRQDLIQTYKISPEKVSTIHLGCDEAIIEVSQESQFQRTERPYLLYVGLRGGYKNFEGLLKAIAAADRLKRDFDLVAFGGGAFSEQEQALITRLNFTSEQVRQIGGSDQELAKVYRKASAFVYPSVYEGFGLPPLEAMTYGCPVVSSQASALPEVIADAAEYFDPGISESISSAIENVVYSAERTQALIIKGHARVSQFTWSRCASQHLSLYRAMTAQCDIQ